MFALADDAVREPDKLELACRGLTRTRCSLPTPTTPPR